MADMQGQVALVTGGSRGIGRAIVERLASRGMAVAAGYANNTEAAEKVQADNPDATISIHRGNIGEVEDCRRVVEEVLDQHGRIDVLVNNAGITADTTVKRMTSEQWTRVVEVNLNGAFHLSSAALKAMLDQEYGRIINISSVIGEMGNIGQANYSAAKAGLLGLTMSMARETGSSSVTVNAVTPGFINTDMTQDVPEKAVEKLMAQIPCGRFGEPDEVARVVEFLADPDSSYITGAVYSVNGGMNM